MPTYSTVLGCDFLALWPTTVWKGKHLPIQTQIHITVMYAQTYMANPRAHISTPTNVKAYTVHACTHIVKPLLRGELWEQLFLCISGLPVWIREKAALPPLNVSWCLPGCLFWEQIKDGPLPLAPTKGEGRVGGRRGQRRQGKETEVDEWVSIKLAWCWNRWMDSVIDAQRDGYRHVLPRGHT